MGKRKAKKNESRELAVRVTPNARPVILKTDGPPFWLGKASIPCWGGKALGLMIYGESEGPSPRQLANLSTLLTRRRSIRGTVEKALYTYYQKKVYGSSTYIGADGIDETEEFAPRLTSQRAIWELVQPTWVNIDPIDDGDESVQFKLLFGCSWDEEHGLEVEFKDWKIVRVGGQT